MTEKSICTTCEDNTCSSSLSVALSFLPLLFPNSIPSFHLVLSSSFLPLVLHFLQLGPYSKMKAPTCLQICHKFFLPLYSYTISFVLPSFIGPSFLLYIRLFCTRFVSSLPSFLVSFLSLVLLPFLCQLSFLFL